MFTARIRTYISTDDIETSLRYVEGHKKVLESYGVKKVTSASYDWVYDPNTYVIIVESEDRSRILGGMRIQVRSAKLKMPMEDAIARVDPSIYSYIDNFGDCKMAEFCGLFNSKEVAGYGIGSMFLGRMAIAVAGKIDLAYLLGLCSPATLRNSFKIGFEIIRELGNNGKFYYPKEGLIATALIIKDLENIPEAAPEERERIMDLRKNPTQTAIETGPKGELEIIYEYKL
jgi:tetrahydromethanopterin S-methyltransferase subunit B